MRRTINVGKKREKREGERGREEENVYGTATSAYGGSRLNFDLSFLRNDTMKLLFYKERKRKRETERE